MIQIEVLSYENWWQADIRSTLQRRFELGDMLLSDILHTHWSGHRVIAYIRARWKTKPAPSVTLFQTSLKMVQVLTDNQRKTLLKQHAPVDVVTAIASGNYDEAGARTRVISDITQGKIRHPWHRVLGSSCYLRVQAKKKAGTAGNTGHAPQADSANNPDLVKIADHGVTTDELALNVISNVLSRLGKRERAQGIIQAAFQKLGWL